VIPALYVFFQAILAVDVERMTFGLSPINSAAQARDRHGGG
jgi:hypothetical protein